MRKANLRKTIILVPPGHTNLVRVKIYTHQVLEGQQPAGYLYTTGMVAVMSPTLYGQFCALAGDQKKQGAFFHKELQLIRPYGLPASIVL